MPGEVDPWPRLVSEMWADRLSAAPPPWPADRVTTHVCEDDKPGPIPTLAEQRVLDLLKAERRSVGELAEALGLRVDHVSVMLNRMMRRGFVTHEGRSWLATENVRAHNLRGNR